MGLEHLLPKSSIGKLTQEDKQEAEKDRLHRKENRCVSDVLKALGYSNGAIARKASGCQDGLLNCMWMVDEVREIPYHFDYSEVPNYDIIKLFTAPTTTHVWNGYQEHLSEHRQTFGDRWDGTLVMAFSCRDRSSSYFAVHNCTGIVQRSNTYLTFVVRGRHYHIQGWKELLGAVKDGWGRVDT